MLATVIVRGAALWVLLGALLKLVSGTPADLPLLVKDLPLDDLVTFQAALAVELAIGVFALVAPRRGVWPLGALLLTFAVVLVWQLAQEAPACGCFGQAVVVDPALVLGIDLTWLGLLLALRAGRRAGGGGPRAVALGLVLGALAGAVPWFVVQPAQAPGDGGRYLSLDLATWPGRRLDALPIAPWLGEHKDLQKGALVIWRSSCPVCRDHLLDLSYTFDGMDGSELLLVRLPDLEGESTLPGEAERPRGFFVHEIDVPQRPQWDVTPPVHVEIVDGVVVGVRTGEAFH
jgi:hypothetical protein